jgi:hypothetical protein
MDRKNENEKADQLFSKVTEYFPKPMRGYLKSKPECDNNGNLSTIVIRGRFPKGLPQYDAKLLELIGGRVTEKEQDGIEIRGQWQGIPCLLQFRSESLASASV